MKGIVHLCPGAATVLVSQLRQDGVIVHSHICNAVLAARIMKATLVLPCGTIKEVIYDLQHFIKSLRHDVKNRFKPDVMQLRKSAGSALKAT
ncbi:O-fucosyltransferase 1-like [Selaginella moellendorffii]|uniref:O-fucosyltransferase 1-like n=1 Tax=Selaginella moellendorffii TaxID=88036 RepID=UPI000D1C77C7|nr:O-fucosyltransferase 1-like [Selaginella moellendorffii]|eukprot:XP_024537352.1 O-fucosyltransferase 1-like [Selaginella moellendorffii]